MTSSKPGAVRAVFEVILQLLTLQLLELILQLLELILQLLVRSGAAIDARNFRFIENILRQAACGRTYIASIKIIVGQIDLQTTIPGLKKPRKAY